MKRYWDYSEQERAEMTRETVESLLKFELMEAGVEAVVAVELEKVPEVTVSKKTMWRVGHDTRYSSKGYFDCLFATQEQAAEFAKLNPSWSDYDWEVGNHYTYAVGSTGLCIESVEVFDHASVLTVTPQLKNIAAIKKRNEQATSEFNEKSKKVEATCEGVWDDWFECGNKKSDALKLQSNYSEYLGMCDGNSDIAMMFLRKTFTDERVDRAVEWLGEGLGLKAAVPFV